MKFKQKWFLFKIEIILSLLGILFLAILLYPLIIITIGPGESGVKFMRFWGGTVVDKVYQEGFHVIPPWDKMYIYNVRVQEIRHDMNVLSQSGLKFGLKLSIRYRPEEHFLGYLHQRVGYDYAEKIVIPEVESVLRTLIGTFKPEEVYTTQREIVQQYVLSAFLAINEKFILLDDVIIRHIELPPTIKEAIEAKLKQQQIAQEYEFRLIRERKEKERKKIEAEGIKLFQDLVTLSLTDRLLRWKGVEATLELAKSENAKIVVIGGGSDGLPIILDTRMDTTQEAKPETKLENTQLGTRLEINPDVKQNIKHKLENAISEKKNIK